MHFGASGAKLCVRAAGAQARWERPLVADEKAVSRAIYVCRHVYR